MGDTVVRVGAVALLALGIGCGRVDYDPTDEDGAPPIDSDFVFTDADQTAFDRGDYAAGSATLAWTGEEVELAGGAPFDTSGIGVYESAVFDTGDDSAIWVTLAWQPTGPYGRPLPDSGVAESGYPEGGADMSGIHLLLHLDGAGLADGDQVTDSSGLANHGQLVLAGQNAARSAGAFSDGLDLDRDAWVSLNGDYFDYGAGDFTYSVWVKMRDCAQSNDNRIALGGAGSNDRPHMWIGQLCPGPCANDDGAFMNFLDDTRQGPSLSVCTGVVLSDGRWHHLAGVKRGHTSPAALVQLFVDGREVDADSYDFGSNTLSYVGGEIRLGSFNLNDPQYHTSIEVDEAAIFKRALEDAEVRALYNRGALDLDIQIRVCNDGACDTEPFVGPDGTANTFFSEADLLGTPGSQRDNLERLGLVGRLAQYRVRFFTANADDSPGLRSVTLAAVRP